MAITNHGGFDDLEAVEKEENLGSRRKIGFGHPVPQEFESGEPTIEEVLSARPDSEEMPVERVDVTRQGD